MVRSWHLQLPMSRQIGPQAIGMVDKIILALGNQMADFIHCRNFSCLRQKAVTRRLMKEQYQLSLGNFSSTTGLAGSILEAKPGGSMRNSSKPT